jgi:uncharacterized protein YceH (UPF0502 family)
VDLTTGEVRVLGALLEKQRTTPDQYPLSLNALRLACNQSTNRDPVVDFDEHTVREALERLARRRWVRLASAGRSTKYRHLLDDALGVSRPEIALLTVLMLRGPQTPGELRSRTERMHHFAGQEELMDTIERLIGRDLVVRLGRRPGQKEERYSHLLGEADDAPSEAEPAAAVAASPLEERVSRLEAEVAELRDAVEALSTGVHDRSAAVKPGA